MKKLFALALIAMSSTVLAQINTEIEYGNYLNCYVYNNTPYRISVTQINYSINTRGGLKFHNEFCKFNCVIAPFSVQKFNGPINSYLVNSAKCEAGYR